MLISKRSWHYKLAASARDTRNGPYFPQNLCVHFWSCVGAGFIWIWFGGIALVFSPVWGPLLALGFGLVWCWRRAFKKLPSAGQDTLALAGEYIVAKKQKICPFIELVD